MLRRLEKKYWENVEKHGHRICQWRSDKKTDMCTIVEELLQCTLDQRKDI